MTPVSSSSDGPLAVARLDGVTRTYGPVVALEGVDLGVERGEVLAVLGPNGAGKTTLVKLLLGLLRPDSGTVRVFDRDPSHRHSRVRTGALLQTGSVPATLKVREHIELFRSYYPAPRPLDQVLSLAGLSGLAERPFGKLSGGQQQRLRFALALCGDPDLLFLDEPTAGLDVEARRALWQGIRELVARGVTVVLTTHHLEEADALADRVVLLAQGRIVTQGSPAEIKDRVDGRRISCRTRLPVAEVASWPGVLSAEQDGPAVALLARNPEDVVRRLLAGDSDLSHLEVRSAALEDAFLALVADSRRETPNDSPNDSSNRSKEVAA